MATRRRSRRKSISGNLTDIQKRIRYLETRPSASRLASKVVSARTLALRAVEEDTVADNAIVRRAIAASAVGTAEIEQDSITNALIATNAVNSDSIAPEAVGTPELANDSVTNDQIATDAVNNDSILIGSVGNTELSGGIADSKISGMSSSKLIGDVEDSQISFLSASKVSGVLDTDNIPNLDTSKITSGVLDIDTIPEITADRMPNLDASKFTTGIFEETNIPNLPASKITTGEFFEGRIPNLSTQKLATGVLSVDRMPVFPESEISSFAVNNANMFISNTIAVEKVSDSRFVRGAIVNNGLSVGYPVTKSVISGGSPASGLVSISIVVNSQAFNAAQGSHVHGQNGYTNVGSTGVASHTHPISIPSSFAGALGESSSHTRTSGGAEGAAAHGSGSHVHSLPAFSGTATSNTSTLKLKKEISIYEVPNIKNLLNLQLKKYKYKNQVRHLQESINRDWMYGYIAEEVEDLGFKELVGYNEKGEPASLNYGLLSTLVLELVKVQQTEISLIKEKIKRQRKKYDKLSS
jgi:hypothetical protein